MWFFLLSLCDFVCGEVVWFLCICLWRLRDFFEERLCDFFVQRLLAFLLKWLNIHFWGWKGCVIKKKISYKIFVTKVWGVCWWILSLGTSKAKNRRGCKAQGFLALKVTLLRERAIWQPMWYSQCSVLQFLQCFCGEVAWIFVERLYDLKKKNCRGCVILFAEFVWFCVWRGCLIFVYLFVEVAWFFWREIVWFFCAEVACISFEVVEYSFLGVERLRDLKKNQLQNFRYNILVTKF